jgi:hypothetical protein
MKRVLLSPMATLLLLLIPNLARANSYSTAFPAAETPTTQGGMWLNGGANGVNWGNVNTSPGLAYGTTVSGGPPYNDSIAVLTGTWGANQTACGTVYSVNQGGGTYEEVEIHLRSTITANIANGYEFNFRLTHDGSQYAQIVRWNGALNSFTSLALVSGPGISNGDIVCATANGSTLSSSINGVPVVSATDSTFTGGSPGMGFWMQFGSSSQLTDYGFTQFSANDNGAVAATPGSSSPTPPVPTANFQTSDATIQDGGSATLSWSSANATSLSIEPGIGGVAAQGTAVVSPDVTTTYTLTASGPGASIAQNVTITVTPHAAPAPPKHHWPRYHYYR